MSRFQKPNYITILAKKSPASTVIDIVLGRLFGINKAAEKLNNLIKILYSGYSDKNFWCHITESDPINFLQFNIIFSF
jgi:hypothetical protein